jgi:LacI family transcriptional regulator
MINAAPHYMFAHYRAAGWRAAMAEAHLSDGPLREVEPTEENGFLAMRALLAESPTAVLCATDRLAVGALHALSAAGLRAGRDVSVIGYDDLPLATYTDPPLTTVAQPIERAAARMVEMLLSLLDGADVTGLQELWQAKLIARASDGPVVPATRPSFPGGETDHETTHIQRP